MSTALDRPGPRMEPRVGWLARVSPLPKLAWLAATVLVVLLTFDPLPLAWMGLLASLVALSARVGRRALGTVLALAPIGASILVLQSIAPVACVGGTCDPAWSLGPVAVYAEGTARGLVLVGRLVVLEVASVALLASTEPADLFAALRRLHVPYEAALMGMLSLWLVPVVRRELREVLDAQRARGLRARGIGAIGPLLVPVSAGTFDRMTTLVLALEARGLGAGPRTSWRQVELGAAGAVGTAAAFGAAVLGVWLTLDRSGAPSATLLTVPGPVAVTLVLAGGVVFAVGVVAALRSLDQP